MCLLGIRFVVLIANMVRQEKSIERNEAYFSAACAKLCAVSFAHKLRLNDLITQLGSNTREESQYDFKMHSSAHQDLPAAATAISSSSISTFCSSFGVNHE